MRVFVLGNINAGKTTIVNKLKMTFKDYDVLQIDKYRKSYGDGSLEQEQKIWDIFAEDISLKENSIIELCGGGVIANKIIAELEDNSCVVLKVMEDFNKCIERIAEKDFSEIPYPKFNEKIDETIVKIDKQIEDGLIENNFGNKAIKIYSIKSSNSLLEIPLKYYECLFKIVGFLKRFENKLFSLGSLARGELNLLSDLDLFLLTKLDIKFYIEEFSKFFNCKKIYALKNKIVIVIDNLSIEIFCISNIKECQKYYAMSLVKDVEKTILIGDLELKKELEKIINNFDYSIDKEIEYTKNRLIYFFDSLKFLALKKDKYKFYFHNNIIIHEIIRLRYFYDNNSNFHYLPKMSENLLTKKEWKLAVFSVNKDMNKHIKKLEKLYTIIINEYN